MSSRNRSEELDVRGELNCIVKRFDRAVELHFPSGTYRGTAIALEPDSVRDLGGFIADILERTTSEDPPWNGGDRAS